MDRTTRDRIVTDLGKQLGSLGFEGTDSPDISLLEYDFLYNPETEQVVVYGLNSDEGDDEPMFSLGSIGAGDFDDFTEEDAEAIGTWYDEGSPALVQSGLEAWKGLPLIHRVADVVRTQDYLSGPFPYTAERLLRAVTR